MIKTETRLGNWYKDIQERRKERNLFATNNNNIKQEKHNIKVSSYSRLPEKQKAIYAGRQHC